MAFPELSTSTDPLSATSAQADADAIVLALPPLDEAGEALAPWPGVAAALTAIGFTGAAGQCVRAYAPGATVLPLIVVGTGSTPDAAAVRDAIGTDRKSVV